MFGFSFSRDIGVGDENDVLVPFTTFFDFKALPTFPFWLFRSLVVPFTPAMCKHRGTSCCLDFLLGVALVGDWSRVGF